MNSLNAFFLALSIIFQLEGGWTTLDGGTNFGIRASTLASANRLGVVKQTDIRKISRRDAAHIYHKMYWIPSGASNLDWPLSLVVFDGAVHAGVGKSKKLFDESLKVMQASKGQRAVAFQYVVERWKHLRSLSTFRKYPGWRTRMKKVLGYVMGLKPRS